VPPIDAITSFFGSSATITSSLSNDLNDGAKAAQGKDVCLVFANAYVVRVLIDSYSNLINRMSGELGAYDIVVGNQGDRNDLALWFKGGSLVSPTQLH
jgi:beta-glucosidase